MNLALDLEHTLILTFEDPRPRPGLRPFLEWIHGQAERLVVFTALAEDDFRAVATALISAGAAPAWFAELEHFRAAPAPDDLWDEASGEIMCKDLQRVAPDIKNVLLLDDNGGYVLPGQEGQWIQIAPWSGDPEDDELHKVMAGEIG